MTTTTAPDLSTYHAIHLALREAASRMAAAVTEMDPCDWGRVGAFARYWKGYAGEVLAHHSVEDDIFFPALLERAPEARSLFERTGADHHHLDELMNAVTTAVTGVECGAGRETVIELAELLGQLAVHMDEHLGFEDEEILPLLERRFTADEYADLEIAAQKALGIGKQAAFTLPFVMHWQPDDVRTRLIVDAPGPFRLLWRLTRRRHARLAKAALGGLADPAAVVWRPAFQSAN